MGGPNREWHIGDHGPTAWMREPKPKAAAVTVPASFFPAAIIEHGFMHPRPPLPQAVELPPIKLKPRVPQSQGRDPNDKVTMELPLEELLLEVMPPIPDDIVSRIAAGLYEEADDPVPWLLLLLKASADSENALKAGRFA